MRTRGNPKKFSYMSRIKYGWNTVRKITFFEMCGIYPLCPAEYPGCIHASLRSQTPGRTPTTSSLVLYTISINYLQKKMLFFAFIYTGSFSLGIAVFSPSSCWENFSQGAGHAQLAAKRTLYICDTS